MNAILIVYECVLINNNYLHLIVQHRTGWWHKPMYIKFYKLHCPYSHMIYRQTQLETSSQCNYTCVVFEINLTFSFMNSITAWISASDDPGRLANVSNRAAQKSYRGRMLNCFRISTNLRACSKLVWK